MYFLLSTLYSEIYDGGCRCEAGVRCGTVRCGAAMWHAGVRWRCVL